MTDSSSLPIQKRVIALVGPTATGKTALGIHIAQQLETEIISADSRVIYQELNIGTAKPTMAERQGIPHHMIDVAHPTEAYSAARYQAEATPILQQLWAAGKIPVVVGGTGFYIRALLEESFIPPVPPDEAFRQQMIELEAVEGVGILHRLLQEKDPERAAALHPNDQFRLIRALEIIHYTGQPVPKTGIPKDFDITWIGLMMEDRNVLRAKIDARIEAMLEAGWLEEVETLLQKYGPEAEALNVTHGYPELVRVIQGKWTLQEAIADIQIQIHQYARRQMTWFRRNKAIRWMGVDKLSQTELYAHANDCINV